MILRAFETRMIRQLRRSCLSQNDLVLISWSVILKDSSVQNFDWDYYPALESKAYKGLKCSISYIASLSPSLFIKITP